MCQYRKAIWGDVCSLKQCSESKNNQHCGECSNFPCELLNKFSYDKEQGDDGRRIKQCEKWCLK